MSKKISIVLAVVLLSVAVVAFVLKGGGDNSGEPDLGAVRAASDLENDEAGLGGQPFTEQNVGGIRQPEFPNNGVSHDEGDRRLNRAVETSGYLICRDRSRLPHLRIAFYRQPRSDPPYYSAVKPDADERIGRAESDRNGMFVFKSQDEVEVGEAFIIRHEGPHRNLAQPQGVYSLGDREINVVMPWNKMQMRVVNSDGAPSDNCLIFVRRALGSDNGNSINKTLLTDQDGLVDYYHSASEVVEIFARDPASGDESFPESMDLATASPSQILELKLERRDAGESGSLRVEIVPTTATYEVMDFAATVTSGEVERRIHSKSGEGFAVAENLPAGQAFVRIIERLTSPVAPYDSDSLELVPAQIEAGAETTITLNVTPTPTITVDIRCPLDGPMYFSWVDESGTEERVKGIKEFVRDGGCRTLTYVEHQGQYFIHLAKMGRGELQLVALSTEKSMWSKKLKLSDTAFGAQVVIDGLSAGE